MSLFSLLPAAAYGADFGYAFNNAAAVAGWRFEHVDEAFFTDGGLFLKGNNYVTISPPAGFTAPLRRLAMELSFKAPKSLLAKISLKDAHGRVIHKVVKVQVLDGSDEATDLSLYFGKLEGAENYINDFVVEFYTQETMKVRLDSLRLYEPGAMGVASMLWGEFWKPDFITGATVGFVTTPSVGGIGFITMLYVLAAVAFAAAFLFVRYSGQRFLPRRASRVFIMIAILTGGIFIVRMDYNWLNIWRDDVKVFSGADVGERIDIVYNRDFDSFFDFIEFARGVVPPGRSLRPAGIGYKNALAIIARYYLLPTETSREADLLWSYGESLRLDPVTGALYDVKGKLIAPRVRVFAKYAVNAAIYEVIK